MPALLYMVVAIIETPELEREYTDWLLGGHLQAVLLGGASSARLVRLTDPPGPLRVETHYLFPNQQAFEEYLRVSAPALRSEGMKHFPPSRGIRFERRHGLVVGEVE